MPETGSIRVLIAEDDDNARALLVELLNTMGHVVVAEVSGGREAIERAKDVVPDVVLLDVHMPDGSGIEAAEQIAAQVPGVAVVLFSGDESLVLSEREVTATSAIAFLPKPTPPRVLDSTLRLAVSRAREFAVAKKDAQAARGALENRKTIERAKASSCGGRDRPSRRRTGSCSGRRRTGPCRWWRLRARCWRASRDSRRARPTRGEYAVVVDAPAVHG